MTSNDNSINLDTFNLQDAWDAGYEAASYLRHRDGGASVATCAVWAERNDKRVPTWDLEDNTTDAFLFEFSIGVEAFIGEGS